MDSQSLSYACCFFVFTFAFGNDHVQRGGERMERGCSNSFGGGGGLAANARPWRRPCSLEKRSVFVLANSAM